MTLNQYKKKRDFTKTPEPTGVVSKDEHHLYVIQKHAASHLHYDFRLELHGVLKSWAVPKGPSLDPTVRRLAMHVEDHPVAYGDFEGIIPKGQYGGGTVMLWDKGYWAPLDENPQAAYEKGHLRFELHGQKLKGRWDLIRFKDEKHWFLIKHHDEFEKKQEDGDITDDDRSVLSHQTMEEISENYQHIWSSKGVQEVKRRLSKKSAKVPTVFLPEGLNPAPFPHFIPPELATLVNKPPNGNDWLHEVKFDGYRILAFKNNHSVILKSRNNKDWSLELASVVDAVKAMPNNFVLDGEVVLLDNAGKSNFQLLQNAIKNDQQAPFIYYVFDLLYYHQYDLRHLPLIERKSILKNILNHDSATIYYSDHILQDGQEMFIHSCELSLEGIVSKRMMSTYVSKRGKDWLKTKCLKRQEFIIGGYSNPQGKRNHFGALYLGVFNKDGELDYTGNVGTGFTEASLKEIYQKLLKYKGDANPFTTKPPASSRAHWLIPKLVCEIEFTEWTKDGHLRHPSFKGLRLDKDPSQVIREQETPIEQAMDLKKTKKTTRAGDSKTKRPSQSTTKTLSPSTAITRSQSATTTRSSSTATAHSEPTTATRSSSTTPPSQPTFRGLSAESTDPTDKQVLNSNRSAQPPLKKPLTLTHPDKILYPEDHITKQDLFNYYNEISEHILPYLLQRPLTLVRCPDNYASCFYQRHYNAKTQKSLLPVEIEGEKEDEHYLYLNNKEGLLSLVQMGVLEIHPWGSKLGHLEQPDIIVIDLDPAPDVSWKKVVAAAKDVREHLAQFKLQSFVKSTGGKGLHVVVPIQPEYEWDEVKEFTHVFVQFLEKLRPDEYVSKMTKAKRTGKIFIDYLRNQKTATAIGTYSTRARIHAPVSTPLFWDELSPDIKDNYYTIKTISKRLRELKKDPWQDFWQVKQSLRLDEL